MGQLVRTAPLPLSLPFLTFLDEVVNDPLLERNWVEMLSQLEFVGCRKMLRSLSWDDVNLKILKHIQEEAQHAYLLKQALGSDCLTSWEQNPLAVAGWDYFSGLDDSLSRLTSETIPYAITSWAIEQRALAVYPAYLARTSHSGIRRAVKTILAQEEMHAKFFGDEAWPKALIDSVIEIERRHWEAFELAMNRERSYARNDSSRYAPPLWEWKEIAATD